MKYPSDPTGRSLPLVLDVRLAALQEIDKVVGNQLALDEDDTTRLRGILFAALAPTPQPRGPR